MNHFLSQAEYAEDQPYSGVILGTHVLHRALQSGPVFGIAIGGSWQAYKRLVSEQKIKDVTKRVKTPVLPEAIPDTIMRTSYKGLVYTLPVVGVLFAQKMIGATEIEWQDRAWRIIGSPNQNQTDEWSAVGMVVGSVAGAAYKGQTGLAVWKRVVTGASLGGLGGVGLMLAYRAIAQTKR